MQSDKPGSSPAYRTSTRHSGTNYIRLIELIPGPPEDPIACTLHNVDLDQPGDFTALSYTWGEPHPTMEILLNERSFDVRKNLWDFLHQTRISGRSKLLWIDAISIDQENNDERNHQVALMSDIYGKATNVIVWLGTATEHSNVVMNHLRDLQHTSIEIHHIYQSTALLQFLEHPYWKRLWTHQEFVLAKQVDIFWGDMSIDTDNVDLMLSQCLSLPQTAMGLLRTAAIRSFGSRAHWHSTANKNSGGFLGIDLIVLMKISGDLHCLDARDRFYGAFGLMEREQRERLNIAPDYSKDLEWLYAEVVSKLPAVYPNGRIEDGRLGVIYGLFGQERYQQEKREANRRLRELSQGER